MPYLEVLFALLLGHYLCDFSLQSDAIASGKNFRKRIDPSKVPPGQKPDRTVWLHYLTGHAAVHAIPVWFVTGSVELAAAELVAHWFIDLGKCANLYGIKTDQGMHILCKVLWAALAVGVYGV